MLKEPTLSRHAEAEKPRSAYSFDQASTLLKNTMQTRLTLQPHQDGAKQLLAEYGEHLVCVRYWYDERRKRCLKTVDLIVEENTGNPRRAYHRMNAWSILKCRCQKTSSGGPKLLAESGIGNARHGKFGMIRCAHWA